jgi:hypothetical protein
MPLHLARFSVAALLLAVSSTTSVAQSTPRDSVVAVVNEFFRAMAASDSSAASRTVHTGGISVSFAPRGDSSVMRSEPLSAFPTMLATNKRKLIERMWEPTVHVHGPIAVVWTQYDFHVDGAFSHCGIDAFTLARSSAGWRIVNIAYTVERTGCKPSPLGPIR